MCSSKGRFTSWVIAARTHHTSEFWIHWVTLVQLRKDHEDLLQGLTLQALNAHVQRAVVLGLQGSRAAQEKRVSIFFITCREDGQRHGTACTAHINEVLL